MVIQSTKIPECSAKDCNRVGQFRPTIVIGPVGDPKAIIARIRVETMQLCGDCRTYDANIFMTDKLWDTICLQAKTFGKSEPDRTTLRIEYDDILPG